MGRIYIANFRYVNKYAENKMAMLQILKAYYNYQAITLNANVHIIREAT